MSYILARVRFLRRVRDIRYGKTLALSNCYPLLDRPSGAEAAEVESALYGVLGVEAEVVGGGPEP
jgi:hypothetical protein